MAAHIKVGGVSVLVRLALLLAGCNFEPTIKPLVVSTVPPQPFSAFAPTEASIGAISPQVAPAQPLGEIERPPDRFGFPTTLAWGVGVLTAVAMALSGYSFLVERQESRPPIVLLVILAIVFLILFAFLMEGLFAAAEAILALSTVTVVTAFLSLSLAAVTAFLVNFEVAFSVYVYRVAFSPPEVEVRLDLRPLNWGLRP